MTESVPVADLVRRVTERAYSDLAKLSESLQGASDQERKRQLKDYFRNTRSTLIRLYVGVKWSADPINQKASTCTDMFQSMEQQHRFFTESADYLYHVHSSLQNYRAPMYDIQTATDVLATGSYNRLPTAITHHLKNSKGGADGDAEGEGASAAEEVSETDTTLQRLNDLVRLRLLACYGAVPSRMQIAPIREGQILCSVENEFSVSLTVQGEDVHQFPWQLVNVDLHVAAAPDSHDTKPVPTALLNNLRDYVQSKVDDSTQPFQTIYEIMSYFSLRLQLTILDQQIRVLSAVGRWEGMLQWTAPIFTGANESMAIQIQYWQGGGSVSISPGQDGVLRAVRVAEGGIDAEDVAARNNAPIDISPNSLSMADTLFAITLEHAAERLTALQSRLESDGLHCEIDPSARDTIRLHLCACEVLALRIDLNTGQFVPMPPIPPCLDAFVNSHKGSGEVLTKLLKSLNAARDASGIISTLKDLRHQAALGYLERSLSPLSAEITRLNPSAVESPRLCLGLKVFHRVPIQNRHSAFLAIVVDDKLELSFALYVPASPTANTAPTAAANNQVATASVVSAGDQEMWIPLQQEGSQDTAQRPVRLAPVVGSNEDCEVLCKDADVMTRVQYFIGVCQKTLLHHSIMHQMQLVLRNGSAIGGADNGVVAFFVNVGPLRVLDMRAEVISLHHWTATLVQEQSIIPVQGDCHTDILHSTGSLHHFANGVLCFSYTYLHEASFEKQFKRDLAHVRKVAVLYQQLTSPESHRPLPAHLIVHSASYAALKLEFGASPQDALTVWIGQTDGPSHLHFKNSLFETPSIQPVVNFLASEFNRRLVLTDILDIIDLWYHPLHALSQVSHPPSGHIPAGLESVMHLPILGYEYTLIPQSLFRVRITSGLKRPIDIAIRRTDQGDRAILIQQVAATDATRLPGFDQALEGACELARQSPLLGQSAANQSSILVNEWFIPIKSLEFVLRFILHWAATQVTFQRFRSPDGVKLAGLPMSRGESTPAACTFKVADRTYTLNRSIKPSLLEPLSLTTSSVDISGSITRLWLTAFLNKEVNVPPYTDARPRAMMELLSAPPQVVQAIAENIPAPGMDPEGGVLLSICAALRMSSVRGAEHRGIVHAIPQPGAAGGKGKVLQFILRLKSARHALLLSISHHYESPQTPAVVAWTVNSLINQQRTSMVINDVIKKLPGGTIGPGPAALGEFLKVLRDTTPETLAQWVTAAVPNQPKPGGAPRVVPGN